MGNQFCSEPSNSCRCLDCSNRLFGSKSPPIFYRGQRRHFFPINQDSIYNRPFIECACCGKNLRKCQCNCQLTEQCLCAGPLNQHRHDFLSIGTSWPIVKVTRILN
ncbi:hypothetical protein NH340_JMT07960 [Sarcoptes scabiei]|nr:hypothetical protein NH340_JMT07960 [Sarcoptes scabiei]